MQCLEFCCKERATSLAPLAGAVHIVPSEAYSYDAFGYVSDKPNNVLCGALAGESSSLAVHLPARPGPEDVCVGTGD